MLLTTLKSHYNKYILVCKWQSRHSATHERALVERSCHVALNHHQAWQHIMRHGCTHAGTPEAQAPCTRMARNGRRHAACPGSKRQSSAANMLTNKGPQSGPQRRLARGGGMRVHPWLTHKGLYIRNWTRQHALSPPPPSSPEYRGLDVSNQHQAARPLNPSPLPRGCCYARSASLRMRLCNWVLEPRAQGAIRGGNHAPRTNSSLKCFRNRRVNTRGRLKRTARCTHGRPSGLQQQTSLQPLV